MDYLDFDIEIGVGKGRTYPVALVRSPAGEAHETMRFPFDELALENQLLTLQNALLRSGGKRRQILSPDEQAVQHFGRALFDALFTGEVRTRYALSQREAFHQDKGVRLKLRIQSPKLAALPWEFLYDAGQGEYICLSRKTPIVRYLELPQPPQPLAVGLPLRILGMIASPKDLTELDVEREKQRVEQAIEHAQTKGMVELTWLPGKAWQELQRSMRHGPWHIFHFIGHGGFNPRTDEGLIALENSEGRARYLSATELGRLLADHSTLRLVVLNSCEGARGGEKDIFSSTAAILVRRGIPAVLAMQYAITDRAAIELSRAFYETLADGAPVDMAVSEARKAISLGVENTVEWGTPVLYMRSPDGVIFDLIQNPARQEELPAQVSEPTRLPDTSDDSLTPTRQAVPDNVVEPSAPVASASGSVLMPDVSVSEAVTAPPAPAPSVRPQAQSRSSVGHVAQQAPLASQLSHPAASAPRLLAPTVTYAARTGFRLLLAKPLVLAVALAVIVFAVAGIGYFVVSHHPGNVQVSTLAPFTYRGHTAAVVAVAWSPDGKRITSGSDDGTVQVWDASTGSRLVNYHEGYSAFNGVTAVAWSPDSQHIASGSTYGTVQVWDASTGKTLLTYTGHTTQVNAVAWSPDGRHIASASGNVFNKDTTVQVWDASTGKRLLTYTGHTAAVTSVAWSPDGKWIASGSTDHTVQVWRVG